MHSEAAFAYSIGLYMYKTRHDAWLLQTLYQLTANLRTVRTAIIIAYLYVRDITAQGCSSRHGIDAQVVQRKTFQRSLYRLFAVYSYVHEACLQGPLSTQRTYKVRATRSGFCHTAGCHCCI